MSNLFWLTDEKMARLQPFFPKSHGRPRVDDRRVLSGIIFINRNGLRWRDAPKEYGPPKTLYNRWSEMGVFARIFEGLAAEAAEPTTIMVPSWFAGKPLPGSGRDLLEGAPHGFEPNCQAAGPRSKIRNTFQFKVRFAGTGPRVCCVRRVRESGEGARL